MMAKTLGASGIMSEYSRLLIDINRPVDHPNLVIGNSRGKEIPGNQDISPEERQNRIKKFYEPYHAALQGELKKLQDKHGKIFYICMHTFNNILNGEERKVDIGLLYRYSKDEAFNHTIKKLLGERTDYRVEFNQPYSAANSAGHTMNTYGKGDKYRCVEFEINDKHLKDPESVKEMGELLSSVMQDAIKIHEGKRKKVPENAVAAKNYKMTG